MALQAKDLMIGDWVKVKSIQKQVKVKEIKQSCIYTEGNGYEYNEIESISLTREILEKNGWKDISDHTLKGCETFKLYHEQRSFDFYITIKLRDYFKLQSLDDRLYTLCDMQFGCRYVHELQHALKLCGIEKEIEL